MVRVKVTVRREHEVDELIVKSGWLRSAACRALSCRLQSCATAGHSTTLCSTPHPWMRPKKMPLAGVGSTRAVRACSWQVARVGKRVVRGRMRTDARGRELGVTAVFNLEMM